MGVRVGFLVLFYANCIKAIFYFSSRRSFPFSCTFSTHTDRHTDTHSWCPKRVGSCALAPHLLLLLLLLLFVEDYGFNAKTKLKTVQIPLKVNGSYDKKLAKLQIGLFSSTKQLPVLASKPALVLILVWLAGWLWHPQKRGRQTHQGRPFRKCAACMSST